MTANANPVEPLARVVVDSVRAVARRRIAVALIGLAVVMIVASAYIVVSTLGVNPARSTISLRVPLPESGGLLPRQDVTLRGVPIGRVQSVLLTDNGVTAVADVDADVAIPHDSTFRVSALSPAGEQYLDIRPATDDGPYLRDGDTVGTDQTTIPVPFSQLVGNAEGVLAQLDPDKIAAMTSEFGVGPQGPHKLSALSTAAFS